MTGATLSEVPQTLLPSRSDSPHFPRCLNCFLLEPEDSCRDFLRRTIAADTDLVLVGEARTASEALGLLTTSRPDLLLLGVELPDANGFEFLRTIRKQGMPMPEVIFISSCDRHALKAMDARAAGYLLKPLEEKKLTTALAWGKDRVSAKVGLHGSSQPSESPTTTYTSRIVVKSHGRMLFLPAHTIDWIQARGNYLTLHVGGEDYKIRESIQSLERRLRPFSFVRIHRSTIVNLNRIREVERWYTGEYIVRLDTGKELTLSKTHRDHFFAAMTPPVS